MLLEHLHPASRERRVEEPQLTLQIAGTPLPHAIALIGGLFNNLSARGGAPVKMSIGIVDINDRHSGCGAETFRDLYSSADGCNQITWSPANTSP